MKFNAGIWPKPQISLGWKKFLEIGLKYKQNHVVGRKLGQNVSSSYKDILNWSKSLKDTSQKAYFESCYRCTIHFVPDFSQQHGFACTSAQSLEIFSQWVKFGVWAKFPRWISFFGIDSHRYTYFWQKSSSRSFCQISCH